VIATATSDRHARAIADSIREAEAAGGAKPLGVEGYDEARWVLIDLGDVIVHVFQTEVREAYDLERLWSDAPPIALSEAARARRRGGALLELARELAHGRGCPCA
jgi:ribosome-associated protein